MTKSTITREQLLEIIETDHVQCGEASYLARMALAAMDSEPVAVVPEDVRQALSKMDDEIIAELDAEESACRAAMDSEPVGSISIDRLLQLLYQFDGANECAASIGDQEYALECGDVASALRELLSCRSALPVADVVAWSNPNEERKCDIRWRRHDVEPGPLYRHAQPVPVVPPEQHWEELCRQHPDMSIGDAIIRAAWWNHCRAAMLQAGNSPVIPDGYVMVPVEPTDEMLAAAKEWTGLTSTAEVVYIKMIEAATQEGK